MLRVLSVALLLLSHAGIARGEVVATYAGQEVTRYEINTLCTMIGSPYSDTFAVSREGNDATRIDANDLLNTSLRDLVFSRRAAQEARAAEFPLESQYTRQIAEEYRTCVAELVKARLREEAESASLAVLAATLEKHRDTFNIRPARNVRYIFRAYPPASAPPATRARLAADMDQLRATIESGEVSFTEAARKFSEASSASDGGDIGWIEPDAGLNPAVMQVINSLAIQELSRALALHNGFYIFQITDRRDAREPQVVDIPRDENLRRRLVDRVYRDRIQELTADAVGHGENGEIPSAEIFRLATEEEKANADCVLRRDLQLDRYLAATYFEKEYGADWVPTEEAIREYYRTRPDEMRGEGVFKLTRYTVPISRTPGASVSTSEQAIAIARRVATNRSDGTDTPTLVQRYRTEGLELHNHPGWIHTTDHGDSDRELLGAEIGSLTKPHANQEKAEFYELHDRRRVPPLPLEEKRDYIIGVLISNARQDARRAEADRIMADGNFKWVE